MCDLGVFVRCLRRALFFTRVFFEVNLGTYRKNLRNLTVPLALPLIVDFITVEYKKVRVKEIKSH